MNLTDYFLILFLIFAFVRGWHKGFLSIILGPIAFIVATIASIIYYNQTKNLLISFTIGLIGPFVLHFTLKFFVNLLTKKNDGQDQQMNFNRLAGGIFSTIWSGTICLVCVTVLILIPINIEWIKTAQENIFHSKCYSLISYFAGDKIPKASPDIKKLTDLFEDKNKLETVKDSPEFTAVFNNEKVKSLYNDDETRRQIEKKDFLGLMKNPKIQAMIQDEELLKKMISLNGRILREKQ